MIIYILIFLLCLFFFRKYDNNKSFFFLFFGILLLSFFAGMRDPHVGTDTSGYPADIFSSVKYYNNILLFSNENNYVEPLYLGLAFVSSRIYNDFNFFLFLCHLIMIIPIVFALKRCKISMALGMTVYMLCFFNTSLNAARQNMAMGFCLVAITYLLNRKYLFSLSLIVLAYGFHNSALLFMIFPILFWFSKKHNKLIKSKLMKIAFVALFLAFFMNFQKIVFPLISLGVFKPEYAERYASSDMYGSNLPVSLFYLTIVNLIFYLYLMRRFMLRGKFNKLNGLGKSYHNNESVLILNIFLYIEIAAVLFCFMGLVSVYATRIGDYFSFMYIIIVPYMNKIVKPNNNIIFLYFCSIVLYWIICYCVVNLSQTMPYTSAILGIN